MRDISFAVIACALLIALSVLESAADTTAARCKSLAAQWDGAKTAKASSPNLGKAKVWARTAAHDCARDEQSHRSDGIDEYTKALQLIGITPH